MTVEQLAKSKYPMPDVNHYGSNMDEDYLMDMEITTLRREAFISGYNAANEWVSVPVTNEYLKQKGFQLIDMMFDNKPMRYYRNGKLIVERTEEGWIIRLYNDKEQELIANVSSVQNLEMFARILSHPLPSPLNQSNETEV